MSIGLKIDGCVVRISEQALLGVVASDDLEHALGNLSFLEKLTDFFCVTDHEKAVTTLFQMMTASNNVTFQAKVIGLAKLATNTNAFIEAFRVKTEMSEGDTLVTVSFSRHEKTMRFEGQLKLWDSAFEPAGTADEYKLKGDCGQLDTVLDAASDPKKYWEEIDKTKKCGETLTKDDQSFESIKLCEQIQLDLNRTRDYFPTKEEIKNGKLDESILSKEQYEADVFADFEADLVERLESKSSRAKKFYGEFCDLSPSQRVIVSEFLAIPMSASAKTADFLKKPEIEIDLVLRNFLGKCNTVKDDGRIGLANLVNFKVNLIFPGTVEEFQTALKKLEFDRAAFYITGVSQSVKNAMSSALIGDLTNKGFVPMDAQKLYYRSKLSRDGLSMMEINVELHTPFKKMVGSHAINLKTQAEIFASIPVKSVDEISDAVKERDVVEKSLRMATQNLESAKERVARTFDKLQSITNNVDLQRQDSVDWRKKLNEANANWDEAREFQNSCVAPETKCKYELESAIGKADPKAVGLTFNNKVSLELVNSDGPIDLNNENRHFETQHEIELQQAISEAMFMRP